MNVLLTIFLLLISMPLTASAQQGQKPRSSLIRAQTREVERRLSAMGYWTGAVDGVFDPATRSALVAFQKWEGREVTGRLTLEELEAIRNRADAKDKEGWPRAREAGYAHVEVDLDRQVLLIVDDQGEDSAGRSRSLTGGVRVLPVSTGTGKPFMDDGQMSIAYTPRGRFVVYDKTVGWEKPPFTSMYYPNYISGGVAIHGYRSVPNQPASHGCIRIPLFAARELSKQMELGTIVLVYDEASFVSGREWAENPELRKAALVNSASTEYTYRRQRAKPRSVVIKKARSKGVRAGY
ncbi:MAG: L,D-transpeptidase family protein [Pyrinomonadaceae bacterium]